MDVQDENAYEDLLGQWSDLESGLGVILGSPEPLSSLHTACCSTTAGCRACCNATRTWACTCLFQLASNSPVGYSASHALVCAVLCHLVATELRLPLKERNSLVHAALTMNVAMTALQDQLATPGRAPHAKFSRMPFVPIPSRRHDAGQPGRGR